ncbi:tRNA (adenosine(37)-N6)-threonylcarbamoyltransferase complex ATPase subunit type 1 TsaE [Mesorhizobium sp. LHD-90]|uniref:tRNA (adenosine(37)-N6)-threonylcarbamoyltransferase complex ATPase subunit type 1 TsaE n=1 Tax=Mesorhizobium sp. LHD-90 TaxID=3071414 RepID=UPI0027DF0979|nr:tRNA (adenosine(37)-N6)-threonylcarbamoyltransferase complex ATPase subunit type 1 TsaE [Mesorhizobium sp. LHD-90]MDQ6434207.1 tRNA (adenosine(37)-N6)-threonylcarbamoyltransferase complex ATPase subunit type 1 TsaE [Mesorhizobium sp. LHD-90]
MTDLSLERFLADEAATARLGEDLAAALKPGDVLALAGDLGAGKTTLARALIRASAGDPELEVPSPTFTLVQNYEGRVPVAHFDLYRLGSPAELDELGFDEALAEGAALVEWPERAENRLPAATVRVELRHEGDGRRAVLSGSGPAFDRLAHSLAIRDFLGAAGYGEARRVPFPGDASARAYETVYADNQPPRVLMNSPRLVLGPPVKDGKPYAVIAHTAQTVAAFVAMDKALRERGIAAPEVLASELDKGFLLLEHLGDGRFLDAEGRPVASRYAAAGELLAMLHRKPWPDRLDVAPGIVHDVPPFDRDALTIEVELLIDWYVPWKTGRPADATLRENFAGAWNVVFDHLDRAERGIVLRDFHSPNIVWRPKRKGFDRLGILDFQDAMIGPSAYDVASLAMDARVTVPEDVERATVAAYVAARRAAGGFDEAGFCEAYAITAAQRNTKILGIFVRLDRRDGKPAYLRHLPRIRAYLRRALVHPALAPVAALYTAHGLLAEDK